MRFTALPVHSFEDATLDLEQLQALLTTPNGQALPFLQLLAAKNVQIAYGNQLFSGSAANTIAVSFPSGIGRAVAAFAPISAAGPSGDWFLGGFANGSPAGTINANAYRPAGNFTAGVNNYSFGWIAIG